MLTNLDFKSHPYLIPIDKNTDVFNSFVVSMEAKYLKEVLGSNLYNAFKNGLYSLPGLYSETVATVIGQQYVYKNDVWEALTVTTGTLPIEGGDWTLIELGNRWLRLKNGDRYLISDKYYEWVGFIEALKPLIYSLWIDIPELTSNGIVIPTSENSRRGDPSQIICNNWNIWAREVGSECEVYNTLYGYLYYVNLNDQTFDDTFDETFTSFNEYLNYSFRSQDRKNVFGI